MGGFQSFGRAPGATCISIFSSRETASPLLYVKSSSSSKPVVSLHQFLSTQGLDDLGLLVLVLRKSGKRFMKKKLVARGRVSSLSLLTQCLLGSTNTSQ